MNNSPLQSIPSATELKQIFDRAGSTLLEFCTQYAKVVQAMPERRAEMMEMNFSGPFLDNCERVGCGLQDPRLLLPSGSQYRALRACPLSVQKQALENGIEVYDPASGDVRHISLDDLSPIQTKQIFHAGILRTIAQQRTWLDEQKQTAPVEPTDRDYVVTKKEVRILKPMRITKQLLKQWCQEMAL